MQHLDDLAASLVAEINDWEKLGATELLPV
jgi:hypothetical protein